MSEDVGKNISKNLSSKYSPGMLAACEKILNQAKQSATDALKSASKRVIQKTAKATADLIENKIADKITRVSKTFPKNNSGTSEEEIPREKYISPELRQKIIDDLRLKEENYWWFKINIIIW